MNLLISILPTIFILIYIYYKDTIKKEPTRMLWKVFFWGALLVIPAGFLESNWWINPQGNTPYDLFLLSFFNIAIIEEGLKFLVFYRLIWNGYKAYDENYDGIVYAVFISLGFATVENIFYVWSYGFQTGVVRALTAVPLHTVCGIIMGQYLSYARFRPQKKTISFIKALVYPIVIHGLYNFLIFLEHGIFSVVVFPILVLFYYRLGLNSIDKLSGS